VLFFTGAALSGIACFSFLRIGGLPYLRKFAPYSADGLARPAQPYISLTIDYCRLHHFTVGGSLRPLAQTREVGKRPSIREVAESIFPPSFDFVF